MNRVVCTLLIVDDSPEDRVLYRRCLEDDPDFSYTILEAALAAEGLALWQQSQPDVILLDYLLPDLDGLDFLAALPSATLQMPAIIVITGQGNETIAVQAMKAGAQDYLIKEQITPERLQQAVHQAIETVQLRSQLQQNIERERLISQIIQKLQQTLDLQIILQAVVDEVRQFLHTDRVLFFQLQPDGHGTVVAESVGAAWQSLSFSTFYDPCLAANYLRFSRPESITHDIAFVEDYVRRYCQGQVTVISDIQSSDIDPCHVELLTRFQVRSNLVIPILNDNQFWGLLIVHHCTAARSWQPSEVDLLQALVPPVSIAIRQAQLYHQVQQDLAERQQSEANLQESEERFRQLAENIDLVFWIREMPEDRVCYVSPAYERLWGWHPEELYDDQQAWVNHIYPEDREPTSRAFAEKAAMGQFNQEYRIVLDDGSIRWVHDRCFPLQNQLGEIWRFIGIAEDITDRKQTQQRLLDSEDRLRVGMLVAGFALAKFDYASNTVELSPAAAALYGLPTDALIVSRAQVHATFHPEERAELMQLIQQVLDPAGSGWFAREHRVVWSTGEVKWLTVRKQVFFDRASQSPKPTHAILVALDITDRKQAEAEREQLLADEQAAKAEAERANRIKDEFLAVLSHELRSPLNPILGWTRLLQTRKLDASKTTEALATIERNVKIQTQLIDDLLDVARILRGKLNMETVPVNLVFVIESAIDTVRTAAVAKSIVLHPSLPQIGRVSGDSARLQQVVWNLLSNAIKFTPVNGRVNIQLEQVDNQAQITISDTGKGIATDFLPHLFESFRQEDASITRKYGGLGLGLAIVRSLVEAHGGTITADSPGEGQGATFIVRLPLIDADIETRPVEELSTVDFDLTGIRVLVVDDELDARDLLTILLTQYGADVMTVTSATEVLAVLASFQPDVLVSDIGLPEIDGYTLLQQIRALPPETGGQVPAIALTAYAREEDHQRAINNGYQYHLTKPFDLDQLLRMVMMLAPSQSN